MNVQHLGISKSLREALTSVENPTAATPEHIAFVTGRLAAPALRAVLEPLAASVGFIPEIIVVKISVAALMTPTWLVGKLIIPPTIQRVILPGLCVGDLTPLQTALGIVVERGPNDLRDLPDFFRQPKTEDNYGAYDIEILAEINHANRLTLQEIVQRAKIHRADGADMIDLGCTPGETFSHIAQVVSALLAEGARVSVDSFDPTEVEAACRAGASLVLSVNESNVEAAPSWGTEVVVIPQAHDEPNWLESMTRTANQLERANIPFRLDPILEPIGFGFATSLGRYLATRARFPNVPMMMGVGNLTELTAVDSAGINTLLLGFCQELRIHSVLTTEVIPWARTSVRELAVGRMLMKHALTHGVIPKHRDTRLVQLRDPRWRGPTLDELRELQQAVTDPNYRIFAEEGKIIALNHHHFEVDEDAFLLFARLGVTDPAHAFYLGWEMMKATLALHLGKHYVQDQALRWGLLTREEMSHRQRQLNSS